MLIAPKPANAVKDQSEEQVQDHENSTKFYQYLAVEQRCEADAEAERLLYVALTRAKRHMHLLGTVNENKEGEIKPTANSLLSRLWPAIGPGFEDPEGFSKEDAENDDLFDGALSDDNDLDDSSYLKIPTRPRINVDAKVSLAPYLRAELPISTTLRTVATVEQRTVLEDNIEDRAVGLVFHELMSRLGLAQNGLSERSLASLSPSVIPRLRHHCHPESSIADSELRILGMAENTLSCEKGQWILGHYSTAANEQALRRRVGDIWRRLIIDRLFVDGDTCWIIDYKTARSSGNLQQFMAGQQQRYAEKMASYREAIMATGVFKEVKTALYFPAHQHLEVID
jgi:ATP-dependent exoDNAse (exonuclease V) beta subunit